MANNPDLSTDAGQFAMVPEIKKTDKKIEFEFIAAVPREMVSPLCLPECLVRRALLIFVRPRTPVFTPMESLHFNLTVFELSVFLEA